MDDSAAMRSHLEASEGALENVSNSIRAIIDDIHPQSLEILGLRNSLSAYIKNNFVDTPDPVIKFNVNHYDEKRLSDDQRLNLYRIILEIVHNIVRHAKATKCNISMHMKNKLLILQIEDNGESFRPKKHSSVEIRGLANINTRSRMLGASVRWGSPDGFRSGTRFELEMPLGG